MSKIIILYHHPIYRLFENDTLVCCSNDGLNSTSGKRCYDCEYNKFGSGENGGKKCNCYRKIWYIENLKDDNIKYLELTGKNFGNFSLYIMDLIQQDLRSNNVLTEINYDEEQDEYYWRKVKKIKDSEDKIYTLVQEIKEQLTHQEDKEQE